MKKRIIGFMLVVCIVIPCVSYPAKAEDSDIDGVAAAMLDILPIKEAYGLADIDFATLEIGNRINVYNYVDEVFVFSRIAYPVFSNGKVIAVLYNVRDGVYQLMDKLAEGISQTNSTEIAIVYGRDGCYAFDGEKFHHVLIASNCDMAKSPIADNLVAEARGILELSNMSETRDLNLANVPSVCFDESYMLHITYVYQNFTTTSNLCWAASLACIVNYKAGAQYTITGMATACQGNTNNTRRNIEEIEYYLKMFYPEYSLYKVDYAYQAPSSAAIRHNIIEGYPILASVTVNNASEYHASVIYGYTSSGSLLIMDPEGGRSTGVFDNNHLKYAYISPVTNAYCVMQRAICAYWS